MPEEPLRGLLSEQISTDALTLVGELCTALSRNPSYLEALNKQIGGSINPDDLSLLTLEPTIDPHSIDLTGFGHAIQFGHKGTNYLVSTYYLERMWDHDGKLVINTSGPAIYDLHIGSPEGDQYIRIMPSNARSLRPYFFFSDSNSQSPMPISNTPGAASKIREVIAGLAA